MTHDDQPLSSSQALHAAERFVSARRLDLAERVLRDALAQMPDDPDLHHQLGWVLSRQERFPEALDELCLAVGLAPEDPDAHSLLGRILKRLGHFVEAERYCREAVRLAPDDEAAHIDLAGVLMRCQRFDEAESHLREALQLDPESAIAHGLLAAVLTERGRHAESVEHGERAVELEPDLGFSHYILGQALFHAGRPADARRQHREALRLEPTGASFLEGFEEADRSSRWPGRPVYLWDRLTSRLPGGKDAAPVLVVILIAGLHALDAPPVLVKGLLMVAVAGFLYAAFAGLIGRLRTRLRPPR